MGIEDYKTMSQEELDVELARLTKEGVELEILMAKQWRALKFPLFGLVFIFSALGVCALVAT